VVARANNFRTLTKYGR
jgi:hypothetical protein